MSPSGAVTRAMAIARQVTWAGQNGEDSRLVRPKKRNSSFRVNKEDKVKILLAAFLCGLVVTARQAGSQQFAPTSAYKKETIQGFTFLFSPQVVQQKAKATELRQEIRRQLKNIKNVVPAKHLAGVRKLRIWVEWTGKIDGASVFHPNADWLRANDYNPDKLGNIEISNTEKFLDDSSEDQPWLLLHELAHAYHFHLLGYDHPGIQKVFEDARDGGTYDSVCHVDGTKKKAYAVDRDAQEYFAELTEAYFGRNDYFPFTRQKLEWHDPDGYKLLVALWGEPKEHDLP